MLNSAQGPGQQANMGKGRPKKTGQIFNVGTRGPNVLPELTVCGSVMR